MADWGAKERAACLAWFRAIDAGNVNTFGKPTLDALRGYERALADCLDIMQRGLAAIEIHAPITALAFKQRLARYAIEKETTDG